LRPGGATPRAGRVAALYDIHGNEPALRAVLAEVEREPVDLVVVGGDVVPGPLPTETIETLRSLERPAVFIRGNTDRWVVEAFDGAEPGPAAVWTARRIDREQRDFLASFAERAVVEVNGLGAVLFCHGSPGNDEEMLTTLTPEERWRPILAGVEQRIVVCGHTHTQFDRALDTWRVVNAGSVGMPYEGRGGAYWALVGPDVELRRTEYDIEAAEPRLRAGGWPGMDGFLRDSFLEPRDPLEVAATLERQAGAQKHRAEATARGRQS
jgi:putative phosphoesterase